MRTTRPGGQTGKQPGRAGLRSLTLPSWGMGMGMGMGKLLIPDPSTPELAPPEVPPSTTQLHINTARFMIDTSASSRPRPRHQLAK